MNSFPDFQDTSAIKYREEACLSSSVLSADTIPTN